MTRFSGTFEVLSRLGDAASHFFTVAIHESQVEMRVRISCARCTTVKRIRTNAITGTTLAIPQENTEADHSGQMPFACRTFIKRAGFPVISTCAFTQIVHVSGVIDTLDMPKCGASEIQR